MSDIRPCDACGGNVGGFHYSPGALRRTWLCDQCTSLRKAGESVKSLQKRLADTGVPFPGMPKGYRWATADEAEIWYTIPGVINVTRRYDSNGRPCLSGVTDIAVPDRRS